MEPRWRGARHQCGSYDFASPGRECHYVESERPLNATSQANVVVTVVDTMPPTGSCPTDLTAPADDNCQAPVPDVASQVVASDNCTATASLKITQDPAAGTMVGLGPHAISIKVT